ncbi:MAG TPA: RNA polymerase sigma factor [Kofleriaceae bacterium]|jgi:RNA polymerase sigma-70 factor (ECF subfamily)
MSGDPDAEEGLTGAELLARWSREELLDRWMRRYGRDVFNVCLAIVGDAALAKDVLQNAFIAVGRDLATFGGRSPVRNWLMKIATHDARDAKRSADRAARRLAAEDRMSSVEARGESAVAQLTIEQLKIALQECLSELSEETRLALALRFRAELSYEEMAAELGVKPDTLNQRVLRALPVLRRCLEQKGWNGNDEYS